MARNIIESADFDLFPQSFYMMHERNEFLHPNKSAPESQYREIHDLVGTELWITCIWQQQQSCKYTDTSRIFSSSVLLRTPVLLNSPNSFDIRANQAALNGSDFE